MFEQLKQATSENHATLEKILVSRLKNLKNENDYGKLLSTLYDFYGPLEDRTLRFIPVEVLPDIASRKRADSLKKDMLELNYTYSARQPENIPAPQNMSHAVGTMYVTEGSTLGGSIIAGMLRRQLKLEDKGLSYFTAYGDQNMEKWQSFKRNFESRSGQLELNEVIQGANSTFIALQKWLELNP